MPRTILPGASAFLPDRIKAETLRESVQKCRGCELYRNATQAVMGEGPQSAQIMFVGEQPGGVEDREGSPFMGPAGKILDRAFADAGIDRSSVYLTNAVKHFKFDERGKRRIHKKPSVSEVNACRPWLEAEVSLIQPKIIVCLGATAAQSVLGPQFRLTKERGHFVEHAWAPYVTATIHPSAILRAPDQDSRHAQYQEFVADLKRIRGILSAH